jgi:hypothetical protein
VTIVKLFLALVDVLAEVSVTLIPVIALASVVAESVVTRAVHVTGINLQETLINVVTLAWESGAIETFVT